MNKPPKPLLGAFISLVSCIAVLTANGLLDSEKHVPGSTNWEMISCLCVAGVSFLIMQYFSKTYEDFRFKKSEIIRKVRGNKLKSEAFEDARRALQNIEI